MFEPPLNGMCPRCNKYRGKDPIQWSISPDFDGCKYCLRSYIPDKEKRQAFVKAQKLRAKAAQLVEDSAVTSYNEINKKLDELLTLMHELTRINLQMLHRTPSDNNAPSTKPLSVNVEDDPLLIKQALTIARESVPDGLEVGRLLQGTEWDAVFGDDPHVFKGGEFNTDAHSVVGNLKAYIAPGTVIARAQARDIPGGAYALFESIVTSQLPDWKDDPVEAMLAYRTGEALRIIWSAMDEPVFTKDDHDRYTIDD